MIHIKLFTESISIDDPSEPQVGDYVIIKPFGITHEEVYNSEFFETHIGQIIRDADRYSANSAKHKIRIDIIDLNYPKLANWVYWYCNNDEIIHYSPNKEDIEIILSANKYNL